MRKISRVDAESLERLLIRESEEQLLPNLGEIFPREKIEDFLIDAVKKCKTGTKNHEGKRIIDFVVRAGYKDEPEIDQNGKPLTRRTTPLHHADRGYTHKPNAARNLLEVIPSLFKIYDNFNVNYTDGISTHFHIACKYGCYDVVKKFLELGQDPNSVDGRGHTALHLIRPNGVVDLAKMLFELSDEKYHPVQVDALDKFGNTPLYWAALSGFEAFIDLLLRQGADPRRANESGLTTLHIICQVPRVEQLAEKFLVICDELEKRVDVNAQDKEGNAPLHLTIPNSTGKEVESLLRRGANPNLAGKGGLTPLHLICQRRCDDNLMQIFFKINDELSQPITINVKDNMGLTPLQLAVGHFLPNMVNLLLDRGADLSSFVFPAENHFNGCLRPFIYRMSEFKYIMKRASDTLNIVERLEKRGYELDRSDALTIMKLFDRQGFFEMSTDFDRRHGDSWYEDEEFASEAKKMMISSSLSLYELIRLQPKEASKILTGLDSLEFVREMAGFPKRYIEACGWLLCEMLCRGFFRQWALEPFWQLIWAKLPIEMCEEIIDKTLSNRDLYNIFQAAAKG